MQTFMQIIFLTQVLAAPTTRLISRPIQIYSKTGKFMNILASGKVMPARGKPHATAIIDVIPVGRNEFKLRGATTGLFVKITKHHKLQGVIFPEQATIFSEQVLAKNNFMSFRLANNDQCRLSMMRKGYRVICNGKVKTNNISFLSRKTHVPNSFYRGSFMWWLIVNLSLFLSSSIYLFYRSSVL